MENFAIIIILILAIVLVFLIKNALFNGSWPLESNFSIDFREVRKLALKDKDALPKQINSLVIATGTLPGWATVVGDFGEKYKIEFPSFQLVYNDKSIIIETPFNKKLFNKFPYGKEYYQENYDIMQRALLEADIIVPTHEHWDHIGGVAQSENIDKLIKKTILTKEQIEGPTIKDCEFPEGILAKHQPLKYQKYHLLSPGVVLIKSPGHSTGHQFIYVALKNGNEFLFTGDVVWVNANFEKQRSRPWLASKKRLENRKQIANQMRWIYDEFYKNPEQKIRFVTTHDPDQHKKYIQEGLINKGFYVKRNNYTK